MEKSDWITALSTYSVTRERILEHRFIADVTSELWRRGCFDFVVSHSEVDNSGYDLIIEAGAVIRHIQLKAVRDGGARRNVDLQRRLGAKPSGCAVLVIHDPHTLGICGYRLFAAPPGAPLPDLGAKPVRHTKANSAGHKAERPTLRSVSIACFQPVADIGALVDRLFGEQEALGS